VIKAEIDILSDFDQMVWHLDEPQADAAPLNVWNICKKARASGYVVLLGGTAGDDLFSGYRRHQMIYYHKLFSAFPRQLSRLSKSFIDLISSRRPGVRRLKKILDAQLAFKKSERSASYYLWLPARLVARLFSDTNKTKVDQYNPETILVESLQHIPLEKNELNQMLYWELKYFLPDHNLNYTDKMSMAHGVEIRVPYLDKELVEFSATIPPHLKMKGTTTKYILRKVAERYLPRDIIYRAKTGFGAPVRKWITIDLNKVIQDTFRKKDCEEQGIFNCNEVLKLLEDNRTGKTDASYPILAMLAIKSWYTQFVERKPVADKIEMR